MICVWWCPSAVQKQLCWRLTGALAGSGRHCGPGGCGGAASSGGTAATCRSTVAAPAGAAAHVGSRILLQGSCRSANDGPDPHSLTLIEVLTQCGFAFREPTCGCLQIVAIPACWQAPYLYCIPAQELADASQREQRRLAAAEQCHTEAAAGLRRQLEAREAAHTDELGRLRRRLEASEQKLADSQVRCSIMLACAAWQRWIAKGHSHHAGRAGW